MLRLAPIVALLILLLAGCATVPATTPSPLAHDRNTLEWGIVGASDVPTLDPVLASDTTSLSVVSLVYGGLVRLDSRLRVRPDGARSWTISHHGTVYTFRLRPNLRFADGRRVTAEDIATELERALGPAGAAGPASFYLSLIKDGGTSRVPAITALDPSTLRITLAHPAAHFLAELAFPVSYIPDPTLQSRFGPGWTDDAEGWGPYRVSVWRHTRYLTLVRNPYYYGGVPRFRHIIIHMESPAGALAAYRAGKLDLISGFEPGTGLPFHGVGIARKPALAMDYLAFNTTRLPFYRLNVRRAFASVWTASEANVMGRTAFPASSVVPSAFGLYSPTWRPSAPPRVYLQRGRYRARSFPSVTLVLERDARVLALARELVRRWKAQIGVSVGIDALNASSFTAALNRRAFDLAIVRWGGDYADPQDFLGTQLGLSPDNVSGWTRPVYARAVALADSYNPSDPRRAALFQSAAAYAASKVPLLPLDEPAITAVFRPDLHGVTVTPLGTITCDWNVAGFTH